MKRINRYTIYIFILCLFAVLTNCEKDTDLWFSATAGHSIDSVSVTFKGELIKEGETNIAEYGICYALGKTPSLNDSVLSAGTASMLCLYKKSVACLAPGTYSFCSYIKEAERIQYGDIETFTVPAIVFIRDTSLTVGYGKSTTSMIVSNNIDLTIKSNQTWATITQPHLKSGSDQYITINVDTNATGSNRMAIITITGREEIKTVKITQLNGFPTMTTNSVTSIKASSASCGGYISSDGGSAITSRGICWSTNHNPTISDNHTSDGSGIGNYTSSLTGLSVNTVYYVRAFAINGFGTSYGAEQNFTTGDGIIVLSTTPVSNITNTTATCGGSITTDGGTDITAKGVCWSTSSSPTISNSHTNDGSGSGNFSGSITSLTKGVKYYVRAFAINAYGTYYGNQVSFVANSTNANLTFKNPIFTDIHITIGSTTKTIPVGDSVTFNYIIGSKAIIYAYTYGATSEGIQIGEKIEWNDTLLITENASYSLDVTSNFFFLYMSNTSTVDLSPIYVNYDLLSQYKLDVIMPHDGVKYSLGYYEAYTNSNVRAYYSDNASYYSYWGQGSEFTLPFTTNQSIYLTNTNKKKSVIEHSLTQYSKSVKVTHLEKAVTLPTTIRNRGKSLYSKKLNR
jgi:hypothetical protein